MELAAVFDWIEANWRDALVAGIVGLASFIVLMWGRRQMLRWWLRQLQAFGSRIGEWPPFDTLRLASLVWVLLQVMSQLSPWS